MKRLIFIIAAFAAAFLNQNAFAQNANAGYTAVDSVVYVKTAALDESLVGKDVFDGISVSQNQNIANALNRKIQNNKSKKNSGFRVRIYFDNKQDSRTASENTMNRFLNAYPGYGAYRSFSNPYFKVTVGDFRTKSEAMAFLQTIRVDFPSAFVVKENIEYPTVDRNNSYITDTIQVYRKTSSL